MVRTLRGLTAGFAAAALIISISGCSVLEQLRAGPLVLTGDALIGEWTMGDRTLTGDPATLAFYEDGTFDAHGFPSDLVCSVESKKRQIPQCTNAGTAVDLSGVWEIDPEDVSYRVWMRPSDGVAGLSFAAAYIGFTGTRNVYSLDFYLGSLDVPEPSYSFHRPRDAEHFLERYRSAADW